MRLFLAAALSAPLSFLGLPPAKAAGFLETASALSHYDRDLIRSPVRGKLKNTPRTPSMLATPQQTPGMTLDTFRPGAGGIFPARPVPRSQYVPEARAAAIRHGVPVELFMALVSQESGWNPKAVSHKGAIGLAQLMPDTARLLRVDPHDPRQNLDGGARYLAQQYSTFRDWRLALAAYNAGPEAVRRHNGIPPYRETRNYVTAILGN